MKDFKIATRMLRYSYQLKTQLAVAVILFAAGVFLMVGSSGTEFLGGFYMVLPTTFIMQFYMMFAASDLVVISPYRRKLQVEIPALFLGIAIILLYTVVVAFHLYYMKVGVADYTVEENNYIQTTQIFMTGVVLAVSSLYFSVAYKFPLLGGIVFCGAMVPFIVFWQAVLEARFMGLGLGLTQILILSYVILLVGIIMMYLSLRLFYKKPVSKRAMARRLRLK